jgi:hypothetical protein
MILNIDVPNIIVFYFIKKRLLDLKDSKRISNGSLQYSTLINKSFRQKTTKKPELNATTEKTDCRVFLPTATQYTFFPAVYGRCGMMNIFLFFVSSSHLCVCVCVCVCMCVCLCWCPHFFFLGSELRVSCLLGRQSTNWTISTALFALVILETESHVLPRLASNMILIF